MSEGVELQEIKTDEKKKPVSHISNLQGNYKKNKAESFVAKLNVNVEEPNAMVNIVRELAEVNENLPMKARLNRNQILALAKAYWYALRYNVQTLVDYCDAYLILTVSESGKGRQELTQMGNAVARDTEARTKTNDVKL